MARGRKSRKSKARRKMQSCARSAIAKQWGKALDKAFERCLIKYGK